MQVSQVWRYPVKSMRGEQLDEGLLTGDGLRGDREWGLRELRTGKLLTARREPRLLHATGGLTAAGDPVVTLPDGTTVIGTGPAADRAYTAWLGRPVSMIAAATTPVATAESFADSTDDTSDVLEWTLPAGRFVDALPLLLLTTASLRKAATGHPNGRWDVRRFRPNLLLEVDGVDWVEDVWCGRSLRVSDVEILPQEPCVRCTMVTRQQPGLEHDTDIFRTLARNHRGCLGVWATVRTPGAIRPGTAARVVYG